MYFDKRIEFVCSYCGKHFLDLKENHRHTDNAYCSSECLAKGRTKCIVSDKQLAQLVKTKSLSQIGRMYGVSCNTIKKYCKKYDINYEQYKKQIKSVHNIMQKRYKDYQNTDEVCPICKHYKARRSKYCRSCYKKQLNHKL